MSSLITRGSKCFQALIHQAVLNAFERQSYHGVCGIPDLRSKRGIHSNKWVLQSNKPSDSSRPNDPPTQRHREDKPLGSVTRATLDIEKESNSQVSPYERIKMPKTQEPRESYLPKHDEKRLTKESRQLENKAFGIFESVARLRGRNKESFMYALEKYKSKESLYRRGSLEMVYAGLGVMKEFGVVKDLEAYKALLQIFPEGKMIPRNAWQVEFMHYPRQQQCTIDLLEQMEMSAVIPDDNFGDILKDRFGNEAHATRKYRRMRYWLPKFKNLNPYPIPFEMPENPEELALIALRRMCVDRETKFTVWKTAEEESEFEEDTFIASAQSPMQQELVKRHKTEQPLFVEGPYPVYLRALRQQYFLLRAEPNINALMKQKQREKDEQNDENLFEWTNFFEEEEGSKEMAPILSVHEQEDSTIFALCITGTSSKSSVVSWVRYLERENPRLGQTPVLFKLSSGNVSELDVIGDNRSFREHETTS